jgi:hypothetical protein
LADSTTWRLPIEIRHAVVPKGMRCHQGSSAAMAMRVPEHEHGRLSAFRPDFIETLRLGAAATTVAFDDFADAGITRSADIFDLFSRQFAFGCEADDRLNALAFDQAKLGTQLRAMFASEIGHWDVVDVRNVIPSRVGTG